MPKSMKADELAMFQKHCWRKIAIALIDPDCWWNRLWVLKKGDSREVVSGFGLAGRKSLLRGFFDLSGSGDRRPWYLAEESH